MLSIEQIIHGLPTGFTRSHHSTPWLMVKELQGTLQGIIKHLDDDYITHNNVAIHRTAIVETGAIIKGPAIIGPHCFIGANAYLRGGVYLDSSVIIGPGCEVKGSIVMSNTHLAHFNFIGDSIIGNDVNFEAGAVICNHWNEKEDKLIKLFFHSEFIETGLEKFGAIVGDYSKIGANAVLSPGTVLAKKSIVNRLELVEQLKAK